MIQFLKRLHRVMVMRKYKENLIINLQENIEIKQENGIGFEIKPIPDPGKHSGMDPRMLDAAKRKAGKLQNSFSIESFQLHEERYRPDKVNYDLTSIAIERKQQLLRVEDHYINTFFYWPRDIEGKMPVILYVHGGAFMTGDHTQYENQCKLLSEKARALVVFPEYRLAPENPFPAGLNDIKGILCRLYECEETKERIDKNRIILVGDSAGASIMNGCALSEEGKKIRMMFEIYPCCDIDVIGNGVYSWDPSYYEVLEEEKEYVYSRMNRLKSASTGMHEFYLGRKDGKNPLVSIVYQEDLKEFPPTVIAIGEYDFLRMSADIFAQKCAKAGKLLRAIRYQGCDHGFFDMLGIMPQAEDMVLEIAKEVRQLEDN